MQAPSQPCGWVSYAPQWSRVERTDRPSSGRFRAKQLSLLHRLQLETRSGTTTATYWTVLAKHRVKCMSQLYSGKKGLVSVQKHTAGGGRRWLQIPPDMRKRSHTVCISYLHIARRKTCSFMHESRKCFYALFSLPFPIIILFFFCSFMCILSNGVKKSIFSLLRCYQ